MRDFGLGVAPGEEEQLFERFYRGQSYRNSNVHGTGLGLAICRAIVGAHGGRIWMRNSPPDEPRGAVFRVFLPIDGSLKGRPE